MAVICNAIVKEQVSFSPGESADAVFSEFQEGGGVLWADEIKLKRCRRTEGGGGGERTEDRGGGGGDHILVSYLLQRNVFH